jgi:ribosomal-protein-alanine N-acetyltransferase
MPVKTLFSKRLCLRPLTLDDQGFILNLVNDPDWLQYIGDRRVNTLEHAKKYIQHGPHGMYQQHGLGLLLAQNVESGEATGLCGLLQRDELPHPDLGFAFLPQYRKQGYAIEAAQLVLKHNFEQGLVQKVLAITSADNDKSINLLKKLSFSYTGIYQSPSSEEQSKLFELVVAR